MKRIIFADSLTEMGADLIQAEEGVCRIEYVIREESFPKLKEA